MALVSQLAIEIAAKMEGLKEGLSSAMSAVMKFANSASSFIAKAFSGIGGVIANIIKGAFSQMSDAQDRLSELMGRSNYLKTPIKDIQALDYAINKVGGNTGSLDVALRTMTKNISQAANGQGASFKTLTNDLKLNAGLLAKESTTQQLVSIQQAIKKVGDQSKVSGFLYNIFGENVATINALMKTNLGESYAAFEKLGTGIDASQEKIIAMNMVARNNFTTLAEGFMNQFTIPFLDIMTKVINATTDFITRSGGVKVAAAQVADGILSMFQAVLNIFNSIESVQLRVLNLFDEVAKKKAQALGIGDSIASSAKALVQTPINAVSRAMENPWQPGWKSAQMGWQDAHSEDNGVGSKIQQDIVELNATIAKRERRIVELDQKGNTFLDETRRNLAEIISNAKDPMKALAAGASDAASNVFRYSQTFSDAQNKLANNADQLAAALKKAEDKAVTWLQNPQSHMGKPLQGLLTDRDKENQKNEIDIPEYMKKEALDIYDQISNLKAGDNSDSVQASLHALQIDILNEKSKGGYGTRNNQESLGKDLQEFLKQKNLAMQKVKVDVNLDMTDEMKKIIKVNGVYTTQDTIDTLNNLKNGNILNTGLAAAAKAAAQ